MCSLDEAFGNLDGTTDNPIPASLGPTGSSTSFGFPNREPTHEIGQYDGKNPDQLSKYNIDHIALNQNQSLSNLEGYNEDNSMLEEFEEYVNRFDQVVERDAQKRDAYSLLGAPGMNKTPIQPAATTKDSVSQSRYLHPHLEGDSTQNTLGGIESIETIENFAPLSNFENTLNTWMDIILLFLLGIFLIFILDYTRRLKI